MTVDRQYQFAITDLIDTLTIDQIKEVSLPEPSRAPCAEEMWRLSHDIDLLLEEKQIKPTGRLLRLIVFLAEANLHIWHNKDRMQSEQEKYSELLQFAQDLNGLRNHVRNMLMGEFGEDEPCNRRATFLYRDGDRWYSSIIDELEKVG